MNVHASNDNPLPHLFFEHVNGEVRNHMAHVLDELAFIVKDSQPRGRQKNFFTNKV